MKSKRPTKTRKYKVSKQNQPIRSQLICQNFKNPIQKLIHLIKGESESNHVFENLFEQMKNKQLVMNTMSSGTELEILHFQEERLTAQKFILNKVRSKLHLLPNPESDDVIRRLFNAGCHQILAEMFLGMTRSEIEVCRRVSPDWNIIVMFYLGQKVNRIEKLLKLKMTNMNEIERASLTFKTFEKTMTFGQFYNITVAANTIYYQ